ncbi:MAG: LamG-like jellyroll fold domain-containing protein [Chloroflexota bacterium]
MLDWPARDYEGQVQSHDEGVTFGASGKEANGDMKLVPMLEIELPFSPGRYWNLPRKPGLPIFENGRNMPISDWLDTSKTDAYGISVKKKDNNGTLLAYVPINVVRDPVGDGIVAFSARMAYWSDSIKIPFGKNNKVRLAWLVRAKIVNPQNGQYAEQTIHTYYDDWYLTGLSVREELGVTAGVVFENPDFAGKNPHYEDNLWALADGLSQTFMAGRDSGTGQRDITIAEIKNRFDKDSNNSVSDEKRWGIPNQALQVKTYNFTDQSGLATLPGGTTQTLLDQHFTNKATDTTLLFVREERFRAANLDQGGAVIERYGTSGFIGVKMAPTEHVLAGMSWAPYRYKGANSWEAYPIADYWQALDDRYANLFPVSAGKEAVQAGQVVLAKSYYLSLTQGVVSIVESGGIPLKLPQQKPDGALKIDYSPGKTIGGQVKKIAEHALKGIAKKEIIKSFQSVDPLTRLEKFNAGVGGVVNGFKQEFTDGLDELKKLGNDLRNLDKAAVGKVAAGAIAGLGALMTLTILTETGVIGADRAVNIAQSGMSLALAAYGLYDAVNKVGKAVSDVVAKASRTAGVIGLVVTIGIQVGLFLFSMISGGFSFGSEAFNQALAALAAVVIYAVLMFAIASIPVVGQVIVAILALIDGIILAVCAIIGASGGACKGIAGNVVLALKLVLYTRSPAVDLQHKDRLEITNFKVELVDPTLGYVVNNKVRTSVDVTSRLYPYIRPRKTDVLEANFQYKVQVNSKRDFHDSLNKKEMNPQWTKSPNYDSYGNDFPLDLATRPYLASVYLPNTSADQAFQLAGVNQRLQSIWLSEAYAIDVTKTTALVFRSSGTDRGTNHYPIGPSNGIKFDVFPRTLAGFYNLEARGNNGWALNWQDKSITASDIADLCGEILFNSPFCPSGVTFPTLTDADGDGLRTTAAYGNDPDDSRADSDSDKLPDFYEIQNGLNPSKTDNDNDGLSDYDEIRLETDPNKADTDGDGLTDKEEVDGWSFTYAPNQTTWVTPDPRTADTDGDGQNDKIERDRNTNPRSATSGGSTGVGSFVVTKKTVGAGQTVDYIVTLDNNYTFNQLLHGTLSFNFPNVTNPPAAQSFQLGFGQQKVFKGSVTINPAVNQTQVSDFKVNISSNLDVNLSGSAERIEKITIDRDKPVIVMPTSNIYYRPQDLVIAFEALDPTSSVASTEVSLDNGANWQAATQDNKLWLFTLPQSNQNQSVQLRATDHIGNLSDVKQINLAIDSAPPTGQIYPAPTVLTPIKGKGIIFRGSKDDNGESGVTAGSIRLLDGAGNQVGEPQPCCDNGRFRSEWSNTFFIPPFTQGAFTPELTLIDLVGNETVMQAQPIQIDNQPPIPDITKVSASENKVEGVVSDFALSTNPNLLMHFEEDNKFSDSSAERRVATCTGVSCPTLLQAGKFGTALTFDGTNDFLEVSYDPTLNNPYGLTIAVWVNLNDSQINQKIVGKSNLSSGYLLGVVNGALNPEIWDTASKQYSSQWGTIPSNQWVHLAVTYQTGDHLIGYVNGIEVGRTTVGNKPIRPFNTPLRIGVAPWNTTAFHTNGSLDELMIYGRPLSAEEIASLANPNPASSGIDKVFINLQNTIDLLSVPEYLPGNTVRYGLSLNEPTDQVDIPGNGSICTGSLCPQTGVPGVYGNAYQFDGVNDIVEISSSGWKINHSSHTLAYWFKTDCQNCGLSAIASNAFGANGHDRHLYLQGGNLCARLHSAETICTSGINYADNAWHHVAHTFGGSSGGQRIYVDGVEKASGGKANSDFTWANRFYFGFSNDGTNNYFKGTLDDIYYYHRALSADEIQSLIEPTYKDEPILSLAFEEKTTTTAGGDSTYFFDLAREQNAFCPIGACPNVGQTGKFGRAVRFDGNTDQAIWLGSAEDLKLTNNSFTAMAWVNLAHITEHQTIFGTEARTDRHGLHLTIYNGKPYFGFFGADNTTFGSTPLNTNQWYHVTWRYDKVKQTQTMFVNGQLDTTGAGRSPFKGVGTVQLGRALGDWNLTFNGAIDEANIYDRALTNEEIALLAAPNRWVETTISNPGANLSAWSTSFPAGLEGIYDLQIRAVDQSGQINQTPGLWRGEVDNVAPRIAKSGQTNIYRRCSTDLTQCQYYVDQDFYDVRDYNLAPLTVPPPTPPAFVTPWGNFIQSTNDLGRVTKAYYGFRGFPIDFNASNGTYSGNLGSISICDKANNCTPAMQINQCTNVYPRNWAHTFNCPFETTQGQNRQGQSEVLANHSPDINALSLAESAYNSTDPITLSVFAESPDYLKTLTFVIDASTIDTKNWPANSVTQTVTSTLWTPPAEGIYAFAATAVDWADDQITTENFTITVDATSPTLTLDTNTITSQNFDDEGLTLNLNGTASDNVALGHIQAQVNGGDWQVINLPVMTTSWTAQIDSGLSAAPEGESISLTVQAFDLVGNAITVTNTIVADAVVPLPFEVSATYNGLAGTTPISDGNTIHDMVDPSVTLSWPDPDGDEGVVRYRAGWSAAAELSALQIANLTEYGPGVRSHTETIADGERLYAHVIAEDAAGNQQIQSFHAPLYVDYKETPTYLNLVEFDGPYHGWLDNSCSLMGVDRRLDLSEQGVVDASFIPQQFYTTWDDEGLALTWTGADWSSDGDLFIYLDTKAGGSIRAYNPYPASQGNTSIVLPVQADISAQARLANLPSRQAKVQATPDQMAADYVVWVQEKTVVMTDTLDSGETIVVTELYTASLLSWDEGSATWQTVNGDWGYHFGADSGLPTTDIYLPFDQLGITDPTNNSLSLVAIASENDALRLWATLPNRNPVNSERVIDVTVDQALQRFALTERYTWASLGDNVCPNVVQGQGGQLRQAKGNNTPVQYSGADVKVMLSANPVGIAYSLLSDNYYFIQDDLAQFSNLVDWDAELEAICAVNPDDPECDRDLANEDSNLDFDATNGLNTVLDVNPPLIGHDQVIEYTIQLSNEGVGASTGIVVDIDTWGPLILEDGDYIDAVVDGEFWEWFNVAYDVGDLAAGESISFNFYGAVDVDFDPNNNEGFATLDVVVYDDTGDVHSNNIDWLFLDHPVDDNPPPYLEVQSPVGLLGPDENTLEGFILDYSAVPTISLRVTSFGKPTEFLTCIDDTPDDGYWSCPWDAQGASDGDVYEIDGRGTDIFGQFREWGRFYNAYHRFVVDAIPPELTLSQSTTDGFGDGVIGLADTLLTGTIADNYLVDSVEICDVVAGEESCELADLTLDENAEVQQIYRYDDVPNSPMTINAATSCDDQGNGGIVRTFNVPDNFVIADVDFGINLDHEFRDDISVYLTSPEGTEIPIIYENFDVDNYDVLLNDAVTLVIDDDRVSHDTSAPYYENERSSYSYFSAFRFEQAQGVWTMRICDDFPDEDDGAYNRSQLILHSTTLPENTSADWAYTLPIDEGNRDTVNTLRIYGLDSVGNRTATPIELTYEVDTTAPTITVTEQQLRFDPQATSPALAGTVSDGSDLQTVELKALSPNSQEIVETLTLNNGAWSVVTTTNTFSTKGTYQIWVEAEDVAGNRNSVGPYSVFSGNRVFQNYFPLLLKNVASNKRTAEVQVYIPLISRQVR